MDAKEYVDQVPAASWPWRLPIIRHIRWLVYVRRVNKHYDGWIAFGQLPFNAHLDYAVCDAIWRGEK